MSQFDDPSSLQGQQTDGAGSTLVEFDTELMDMRNAEDRDCCEPVPLLLCLERSICCCCGLPSGVLRCTASLEEAGCFSSRFCFKIGAALLLLIGAALVIVLVVALNCGFPYQQCSTASASSRGLPPSNATSGVPYLI